MSLITGNALDPNRFFSAGKAVSRGTSFDLSIGTIYDHEGKLVAGDFKLDPGQMVQVVSAEIFNLPETVTGHVTYKTTLTKQGIWALTIGIVDPGWNGPVTTSLLNFSKVPYLLKGGDAFLRVSLFEHPPIASEYIHRE
jgi:deoxycytidine triphosphate deaminase